MIKELEDELEMRMKERMFLETILDNLVLTRKMRLELDGMRAEKFYKENKKPSIRYSHSYNDDNDEMLDLETKIDKIDKDILRIKKDIESQSQLDNFY